MHQGQIGRELLVAGAGQVVLVQGDAAEAIGAVVVDGNETARADMGHGIAGAEGFELGEIQRGQGLGGVQGQDGPDVGVLGPQPEDGDAAGLTGPRRPQLVQEGDGVQKPDIVDGVLILVAEARIQG